MISKAKILEIAKRNGKVSTSELIKQFSVSRQYLNRLIKELILSGALIKIGTTRSAFYTTPAYARKNSETLIPSYTKSFKNIALEEHKILEQVEQAFPPIKQLPENIHSIFSYAFSEMLNNAIEHSQSKTIKLEVSIQNKNLIFIISDNGIGAFRNIKQNQKLESDLEAIQELLKGKTTTMPKSHSGEGIFFTSKAADLFMIDSFGYQLTVDNTIPDVLIQQTKKINKGTKVIFKLKTSSRLHLDNVFKKYTNLAKKSDYGFDKTEIRIKLYSVTGIHFSRSQARRILKGLEKFKVLLFDFNKVPMIGQAFADEIFRVFHNKYPLIKLETEHMNASVKFMVERAKHKA